MQGTPKAIPSRGRPKTIPKTTLKEVVIPPRRLTSSRRISPSQSPETSDSGLSSVGDQFSDYETPETSAIMTPAESLVRRQHPSKVFNEIVEGNDDIHSTGTGGSIKRKRAHVDEDALLAQRLQEEEYQMDEESEEGVVKRRRTIRSKTSLDLPSLSDRIEALLPEQERGTRGKSSRTRGAQPSGRRSITANVARQVVIDTESDEAEESEYITGEDVDDPAESEDEVEETSSASEPLATTSARARSRHTVRSRNRRSLPDRRDQRLWATNPAPDYGGAESWRSRRLSRVSWHLIHSTCGLLTPVKALLERRKLENAHPEIVTMWETLRSIPVIVPIQAEQPKMITRKLKAFQLEGLDWMMKQEKSKWRGGLLGDEMGMGKTIQAVSLIMSDYPAANPTLVVVPPVALMQWQNEIKEYTNGKLKVLIYHNTNHKVKNMKLKDLKSYDVIMISYSGLESTYRKESKGWKRDDGLVKENSKIHAIQYHRLILDEAHNIKTRTTGVAKACFALKSDFKWCLSGTPVQNRIGEFFSLLRFLQIRPFACYFCKSCDCAQLHWSQDTEKKCKDCSHSGFQHVSVFNQELLNPITQGQDPQLRKEALGKLRLVTDRIMLRRMKRDHTASMELPPKEVMIHREFFGEIERDFSSSIMTNTTRQFDTYVSRGVMLNNYANIFGLIMQMRQVANHPDLILKKHAHGGQNVIVCCICDETAEEPIRSRCHHEFCRKCAKDYVRSFEDATPDCPRCHIALTIDFDQPDIEQEQEHVKKNSIINRIKMEEWTSSTKIEMLIYDLYKLRSPKQTNKSIVFSQFTSMLQLVEWRLRRAGFKTVMLDGSMSPAQRQRSIEFFMSNTDVEVFLVSLKAGGVALNLTEASRVFIIDP